MKNRNFDGWLAKFRFSISGYDYYIDFNKVVKNVEKLKIELSILNSLIGSKDIERDFENIIKKYPETLKCVPLLLAVRQSEIYAQDEEGTFIYNFNHMNYSIEQYKVFMRKTGLFNLEVSNSFKGASYIIEDIKYFKNDTYECVLPIFNGNKISTNF